MLEVSPCSSSYAPPGAVSTWGVAGSSWPGYALPGNAVYCPALARLIELDERGPTAGEIGTDPQWLNDWYQAIHQARQALAPEVAISGEQYHEDDGPVLWWRFPVMDGEQPWVGTPNDCDWPGYHTHFTSLPPAPVAPTQSPKEVP
jgi:hypothetical protein